jgi:hypothetical protein
MSADGASETTDVPAAVVENRDKSAGFIARTNGNTTATSDINRRLACSAVARVGTSYRQATNVFRSLSSSCPTSTERGSASSTTHAPPSPAS